MNARSLRLAKVLVVIVTIAVVLGLTWPRQSRPPGAKSGDHLLLYCAAGLRDPLQSIIGDYQCAYGLTVDVQYGGSGTLLSSLAVAGRGDLYLAADARHMDLAVERGLAVETIPIARQHLVLLAQPGNPKRVRGLADLVRPEIRVAYANPEVASAGKAIQRVLEKLGTWEVAKRQAAVFKPTVNDVANDVVLGSVDVGVVWQPLAALHPGLASIAVPELTAQSELIRIGVLTSSTQARQALHFARYLSARDRGLETFARAGYQVEPGDAWAETPLLTFFSGGLNRIAIEQTLRDFEAREGCTVRVVYNGCGILVAQINAVAASARAGGAGGGKPADAMPDAYLACDVSFLDPVSDHFGERTLLSETEVVVLVPKANPHGLRTLADLARPGLKLGVCNAEQSTLGALTARLLQTLDITEAVMRNVRSQTPTADMLVTQIQAGSLDAVVVYRANAKAALTDFIALPIDLPQARAIQPFAVSKQTRHPQLMQRLQQALTAPTSRARYTAAGFRWHAP